ncbi:DUF2381 family protein [Cystobacter fuscus]|uniref:DUF2381 family protein n=1 Tax=Cystobacter fuscus TaxID=43 RepID=UPI002B2BAE47|nr:DUF2381 family protein [Cystobacter fuscus]
MGKGRRPDVRRPLSPRVPWWLHRSASSAGPPGCGICYGRPERSSALALPPPLPLLVLLPLALGTPSVAQPPPARERQERQVVVPNSPEEPVPEVRVAANVATYLRFDAPIDRASVEVEGRAMRFRVVDPGERTLTLEPTMEPGPGEKPEKVSDDS